MNRRAFLASLLGGAAAALAFDPERALWTPGAKLISIPAPTIYSGCDFPREEIFREGLKIMERNIEFLDLVAADFESIPGVGKIGKPLNIRRPRTFRAA